MRFKELRSNSAGSCLRMWRNYAWFEGHWWAKGRCFCSGSPRESRGSSKKTENPPEELRVSHDDVRRCSAVGIFLLLICIGALHCQQKRLSRPGARLNLDAEELRAAGEAIFFEGLSASSQRALDGRQAVQLVELL